MSQTKPTPDSESLGILLRRPTDLLVQHVYEKLKKDGFEDIRPTHGVVLRHIEMTGSRASDLALKAQMTKQSMAYLIENLQSLGYVEQIVDPEDGRARLVLLTERGKAAHAAARQASRETEKEWSALLGSNEWTFFHQLLIRLNERLVAATEPQDA